MKTLYIIRHAKSSWSFDLADHDRPLGFRGRKDVRKMGLHLSQHVPIPDKIITSTASRALYTALFMADDWGYPEEEILLTKELYHAGTEAMIELLKNQTADTIAIFGHNPGLTELANRFVEEYISNIPTTGIVGIQFEADHWNDITQCESKQLFFDYPKGLKMKLRP